MKKWIKLFLILFFILFNLFFSGKLFALQPAGEVAYDLGHLMTKYLGIDIAVENCIKKYPQLKVDLNEASNFWKNKNKENIKRLNKVFTAFIYKNSKDEVGFEQNLSKLKQKMKDANVRTLQNMGATKLELTCRVFPIYIKSKKGDFFQTEKDRLDNIFSKDLNVFTPEPKIARKEDRFSSENPTTQQAPNSSKRPESKDYLKKLADAKEYGKYNNSVILFINRFATLANEISEIQDLCGGILSEEVSTDYANKRVKIIGNQAELKLQELKNSLKDIYKPVLTSSLKDSVALLNIYISTLPKDARDIIDNYYGLFRAVREGNENDFFKFTNKIQLNGIKLLENQNAIISLEKSKIDEEAPIFYLYDTIQNLNRSYIALVQARISEANNPAESQLDFLEGDVALNIQQAEKYIEDSKDSVAKGYFKLEHWINKLTNLGSEREYLPLVREVETIFKEALSGEEKLIEGLTIILADFPKDDYLDDFSALWDQIAYQRQSYFKKIWPLISKFNAKFNTMNRGD